MFHLLLLTVRVVPTPSLIPVISRAGIHPTAAFIGDSLFGCHPLKTQFTDQSSDFVNEWHWYFVDDGESTEQNPMHTFQDTLFGDVALGGFLTTAVRIL